MDSNDRFRGKRRQEDHIEPARQDTREIFVSVIDRCGVKLADQRRVRVARGAPQLDKAAEHEQRLADGAGGALHERALALLHPGPV